MISEWKRISLRVQADETETRLKTRSEIPGWKIGIKIVLEENVILVRNWSKLSHCDKRKIGTHTQTPFIH